MTEIYLIRHTQAEGNLYRMMQGHRDSGITPQGKQQIDRLAERFRDVPVDSLWSSDLYRARMTANAIRKYHDLPLQTDRGLREIDMGSWEGKFFGDLEYADPESIRRFIRDPYLWLLEGAETYEQTGRRAMQTMTRIAEENDGKTVVVTSHGVTIRTFLSLVTGVSLKDTENLPVFGNTSVSRLTYEDGRFRVDYMNSTSHLEGLSSHAWSGAPNLRGECFDPTADRSYYSEIYADTWKSAHGSLKDFTALPYYSLAVRHYRADPENVIRLYDGETPAGLLETDSERGAEAGYLWIVLLNIREDLRGKGCGAQALGRAVCHAQRLGRRYLRLNVSEENRTALHFYEKTGFYPVAEERSVTGVLKTLEWNLEERDDA